MTVTYTAEVATVTGLGLFWKLLFRWRGSIYKLLWPDLLVYTTLYFSLSFIYRFALNERGKVLFEDMAVYCRYYAELIPLTFVLGFYVDIVVGRWSQQFTSIPWPDALAMFVSTCIHGEDERGRLMRRTIMRYVNLSYVLTLTMMCTPLKKRFPTLDHMVEAGLLQESEKTIFEDLDKQTQHPKYWMPLVWAASVVARARKENRIKDDFSTNNLIIELCKFRGQCGNLLTYDWISVPLVYTQVVTLAVYFYVLASVMGRQYLDPKKKIPNFESDFYIPFLPFLQFFFYMGWLKVAESLVNPFGEDDDDFEVNWLVDRNVQVSYLIVDEMHNEHPELIKDQYWEEVFPQELPYTAATEQYRGKEPQASTAGVELSEKEAEVVVPAFPAVPEDDDDDDSLELWKMNVSSARGASIPKLTPSFLEERVSAPSDRRGSIKQHSGRWLNRLRNRSKGTQQGDDHPLRVTNGPGRQDDKEKTSDILPPSKFLLPSKTSMRTVTSPKSRTTKTVKSLEDVVSEENLADTSGTRSRRQDTERKRKMSAKGGVRHSSSLASGLPKKLDYHPFWSVNFQKPTEAAATTTTRYTPIAASDAAALSANQNSQGETHHRSPEVLEPPSDSDMTNQDSVVIDINQEESEESEESEDSDIKIIHERKKTDDD